MTGVCECGCGQPAPLATKTDTARGYIKGQPRKFIHGHNARLGPDDYMVVDAGHDTPCWEWLRTVNADGYGMVHRAEHRGPAHIYFYEKTRGAVPDGLQLDHLCRNRLCVNPDHLEPVTAKENVRRGWEARYAGQDHSEMRAARLARGLSQAEFAQILGVTQSTVGAWERGDRPAPREWSAKMSFQGIS